MTTDQKLEHARCLANATRHYLNSAYNDLHPLKTDPPSIPAQVVYEIVGHIDNAQKDLNRLAG